MKKELKVPKRLALFLAVNCMAFMTACGGVSETVNETGTPDEVSQEESASDAVSEEKQDDEAGQELEKNTDSSKEESLEEGIDSKQETTTVTALELSDDLYDFQISIDGTVYQFPMWYSDFEALGWQYDGDNTDTLSNNQYVGVMRWRKDGAFVNTEFANMSMNTVAFSDSMVSGISIDRDNIKECDWEIRLPNGIRWGVSNADDIKAAYGDPTSDYDGDKYYKMIYQYDFYREICLYVYKDTGVLGQVEIENIIELENSDALSEEAGNPAKEEETEDADNTDDETDIGDPDDEVDETDIEGLDNSVSGEDSDSVQNE